MSIRVDTTDLLTVDRGGGRAESEQLGRTDLTENLLDHLADGTALISPFGGHRPYMTVLEAIQSQQPVPLTEGVTVEGSGPQAHPVIDDIEHWARQAAETGRGFAGAGAPWATSLRARRPSCWAGRSMRRPRPVP